jgi:OCT family organic cation transporter-like MFS transporter 4/5
VEETVAVAMTRLTMDEAYEKGGKSGRYTILLSVGVFASMIASMMYLFSLPLFSIFPEIIGCGGAGNPSGDRKDGLCRSEEEACRANVTREYVDRSHNFISEYDLVCDDFRATLLETSFALGSLLGTLLFGFLSDSLGRLPILGVAEAGGVLMLLVIVLNTVYPVCVIFTLLLGFLMGGVHTPTFALAYDSVHSDYIPFYGTFVNLSFAVGEVIVAAIMWTRISWRAMCYIIMGWTAFAALYLLVLYEPPRFLLGKGRQTHAVRNLHRIAAINGYRDALPESLELVAVGPLDRQAASCKASTRLLLEKPTMLRLGLCMLLFVSCSCIYYGISLSVQKYQGNPYINAMLIGIVEIVAISLSGFLSNAFGKRFVFGLCFAITAGFMLLQGLAVTDPAYSSLCIAAAKFGISASFNVVYVVTGEMFPSAAKNTALAACVIADRIGTICGPLLALSPTVFLTVSTILCATCVLVTSLMPLVPFKPAQSPSS